MKTKTFYEFKAEYSDEHGDIFDSDHADTLSELLQRHDPKEVAICLVRDVYEIWTQDDGNLIDREHAYFKDGKLPEEFDQGATVPKRFQALRLNT